MKTLRKLIPEQIIWQTAREALLAAGLEPLVLLGNAEHWVGRGRHVVLESATPNGDADNQYLKGAYGVSFSWDNQTVFAQV